MGDISEMTEGLGETGTDSGGEIETMPPFSPRPPALNSSLWGRGIGSDKSNIQSPAFD